jgi:hypothetical protein
MPNGNPGDGFIAGAGRRLHSRFDIGRATLLAEISDDSGRAAGRGLPG